MEYLLWYFYGMHLKKNLVHTFLPDLQKIYSNTWSENFAEHFVSYIGLFLYQEEKNITNKTSLLIGISKT